jgi:hypothetical protein
MAVLSCEVPRGICVLREDLEVLVVQFLDYRPHFVLRHVQERKEGARVHAVLVAGKVVVCKVY